MLKWNMPGHRPKRNVHICRHEVVTLKRRALIWMLTVDQDLYVDKCPADRNKDNMVDLKEWKNYWLGIAKKHGINYYVNIVLFLSCYYH